MLLHVQVVARGKVNVTNVTNTNADTALFKIVVTPHFGYMGGHAKYKSGVHSYLVKLELWNSYPPCLARQPTDEHPHLPYPS